MAISQQLMAQIESLVVDLVSDLSMGLRPRKVQNINREDFTVVNICRCRDAINAAVGEGACSGDDGVVAPETLVQEASDLDPSAQSAEFVETGDSERGAD